MRQRWHSRAIARTPLAWTCRQLAAGMTPVDPLFPQPPEITVLGPLGTFRLFGTMPNDNHFETRTCSLADNVSVVRGTQRIRDGRIVPDAVQRTRRHWRCARQDLIPDVRGLPAGDGVRRRRSRSPYRPQQHSVGAGQRRRGSERRGGVPVPPLLRRRLCSRGLEGDSGIHPERGHAMGVHRTVASTRPERSATSRSPS